MKNKGNNFLIVSLYVDDLLVTGDDARLVEEFKQEMMQAFEMIDLGLHNLFSWNWDQAKSEQSVNLSKEICKRNFEEVSNGGMQIY